MDLIDNVLSFQHESSGDINKRRVANMGGYIGLIGGKSFQKLMGWIHEVFFILPH